MLGSARDIFATDAAELRSGKAPRAGVSAWRRRQMASAVAVNVNDTAFRSDPLVGTGVVNPQDDDLGSIDDIVMSPQTGKVALLVIVRGGVFGIGKKHAPVPWADFKAAPGNKLFVLAATKATMDAAPQVKEDQNSQTGHFTAESLKVNAYGVANLSR